MQGLKPGPVWALAALVAAMAVAGLASPAQGDDVCGGVYDFHPHHLYHGQPPPLAIGDSTMLLALPNLTRVGYEADAHGCRQFSEALALMRARKANGTLPHLVVLALGANGSITAQDIRSALSVMCCDRVLGLVTPRELGGGSGEDAATVREEAQRYPKQIVLLDWVNASAGHTGWFQPDGLHLTAAGAVAFAHMMARVLPYAYPKPAKQPPKPQPSKTSARKPLPQHPHQAGSAASHSSGSTTALIGGAAALLVAAALIAIVMSRPRAPRRRELRNRRVR